jgi:hypothetical protein
LSDSNPFIFGIPGCDTHLKAWTILNAFCQKFQTAGITSTSLCKYLATTAQALDLGEQQIGWIAHHMGHSKEVHHKYYRKMMPLLRWGRSPNCCMPRRRDSYTRTGEKPLRAWKYMTGIYRTIQPKTLLQMVQMSMQTVP